MGLLCNVCVSVSPHQAFTSTGSLSVVSLKMVHARLAIVVRAQRHDLLVSEQSLHRSAIASH